MINSNEDNKNIILNNYKNLIVGYEGTRQRDKKIVNQYEQPSDILPFLYCSQVVAYNTTGYEIKWELKLLDGTLLYKSKTCDHLTTFTYDITELNLATGTHLQLACIFTNYNESYATEILEYRPSSNTVYFDIDNNTLINYVDMIASPLSPPLLSCTSFSIYNDAIVLTKYKLRLVSNGIIIYESNRQSIKDRWTCNLYNLSLQPGTQFRLHASVIGGSDSEPYAILVYDPNVSDSISVAHFTLYGAAMDTSMNYKGSSFE